MRRNEDAPGWRAKCRPLLVGMIPAIVAGAVCLLLTAVLMTLLDLPSLAVTAMAVAAAAVGAFVGGFFSAKLAGEQGWIMGALCGLVLFVPILIAGLCLHRDVHIGFLFIKLATLLLSGMVGGMIGVNKR